MVVACIALFVAGGGSAVAARGLIGGDQIKRNAIVSKHVKPRSLRRSDFARGQLPAGPRGRTGATGATGAAGAPGRDGFGLVAYRVSPDTPLAANSADSAEALCPGGTVAVGGAARVYDTQGTADLGDDVLIESDQARLSSAAGPTTDANGIPVGWSASAYNNSTQTDRVVSVVVTCANAAAVSVRRKQALERGR